MNVLSLFNGMGCIWLALDKLNVKVNKRYVSEIDKHANKVNDYNYPDTIHLGDVRKVDGRKLGQIDLLVGGSPCQGFSFAGKGLNFEDPRSKLFFEFVRILNEIKEVNPKVTFLLENVKMKKQYEMIITEYLGVYPIFINSNLVSAQERKRLYWTNINLKSFTIYGDLVADIPQPEDRGIFLKDILQDENSIDKKYLLSDKAMQRVFKRINESKFSSPGIDPEKSGCLCTRSNSGQLPLDKSTTLISVPGNKYRRLTPVECCRLQTVPDDYFFDEDGNQLVSDTQIYKMLGNGWTVDVITHILSFCQNT